jgi:hypothetical protein
MALSFAEETSMAGLVSVFDPPVYASAAVASAPLLLSCKPHVSPLVEELTVTDTALDALDA